jgi:hypothetical protein
MNARFTVDGSPPLEQALSNLCETVRGAVRAIVPPARLKLLLLGGGYGRGEGGVLRTPEGDQPYNDLEFYVFIRGPARLNERRYRPALDHLGETLSAQVGIEVEFKILSPRQFRRGGVTMFFYDLMMGHKVLAGDPAILAGCEHHRAAHQIPLAEATRLLMNRGSGLLFALEKLRRTRFGFDDADFVGRNLAKAQLGLGDVVLAASGQYHWSCRERHRLLEKLDLAVPWVGEVRAEHAQGVRFKLHPCRSRAAREELLGEHERISQLALSVWLWLESRRLGRSFASAREYAESSVAKCPESPAWRNWLIHGRTFGVRSLLERGSGRYPRERLLHALALLLWEPGALEERVCLDRIQSELKTSATDRAQIVSAYERLWRRFN